MKKATNRRMSHHKYEENIRDLNSFTLLISCTDDAALCVTRPSGIWNGAGAGIRGELSIGASKEAVD